MARMTLGQLLLRQGAIDEDQLKSALGHQRRWGVPLGKALVELRFCTEDSIATGLSEQTGLKLINLDEQPLGPHLAMLLPQKVADAHRAVALRAEGRRSEVLVVAVAGPASLEQIDAIRSSTGKGRVLAHLASDSHIQRAIERIYSPSKGSTSTSAGPQRGLGQGVGVTPPSWESESEFEFDAADRGTGASEVLLFGWSDAATQSLHLVLESAGLAPRSASAMDISTAGPKVVIVSPLPAIEAHLRSGEAVGGQLVVAVKSAEADLPRAQAVKAKGLIQAPVDTELLLRAIKRSAQ